MATHHIPGTPSKWDLEGSTWATIGVLLTLLILAAALLLRGCTPNDIRGRVAVLEKAEKKRAAKDLESKFDAHDKKIFGLESDIAAIKKKTDCLKDCPVTKAPAAPRKQKPAPPKPATAPVAPKPPIEPKALPLPPPPSPAPAAVPAKVQVANPGITLVIKLWDKSSLPPELIPDTTDGLQSRDIGAEIRRLARINKVQSVKGIYNFQVELYDSPFSISRGRNIFINSKLFLVPDDFGPKKVLNVEVRDGEGSITIPSEWIEKSTAVEVYSPWRKPEIFYPPSGSLKTCGPATSGRCGKRVTPNEPSELYRIRQQNERTGNSHWADVQHMHFVK